MCQRGDTIRSMSTSNIVDPANVPAPPSSASSWLDLLDKANRLNIVPIIACAVMGYLFWKSNQDNEARLAAAEARTRAALVACSGSVREESSRTREEVRKKAADLQGVIEAQQPSSGP